MLQMRKNKILCITDQPELRALVRQMLLRPKRDIDFKEAITGEEGLQIAREMKPNIVLMDIGLHSISGIDAARFIKKELPACRIVMLTMYLCHSNPIGV